MRTNNFAMLIVMIPTLPCWKSMRQNSVLHISTSRSILPLALSLKSRKNKFISQTAAWKFSMMSSIMSKQTIKNQSKKISLNSRMIKIRKKRRKEG